MSRVENIWLRAAASFLTLLALVFETSAQQPARKDSSTIFGSPALKDSSILLNSAGITASAAPPVKVVGDTIVYNATMMNVDADAVLEDILKKIPGLEVDESGNIFMNGRQIRQLLLNGKKYFGGDIVAGLRSLPAGLISDIRTYERESDLARISGVDDGETEDVIDVGIKRNMMDDWNNNANIGAGSAGRYGLRAGANKITDHSNVSILANSDNLGTRPSIKNASQTRLGRGQEGDSRAHLAGVTFARNTAHSEMEGHVKYNGTDSDVQYTTESETFHSGSSSSSTAEGSSTNHSDAVKADCKLIWRPEGNFTFIFSPSITFTESGSSGESTSSTFNESSASAVNSSASGTDSDRRNFNETMTMSATWRSPANKRRTVTARVTQGVKVNLSDTYSDYTTRYYNIKSNPDSTLVRMRYTDNDTRKWNVLTQMSWNEPVAAHLLLQSVVSVNHHEDTSSRDLYNRTDGACIRLDDLSSSGTYRYDDCLVSGVLVYNRNTFRCNLGVQFRPTSYHISYPDGGAVQRLSGTTLKLAPYLQLRCSKRQDFKLNATYRCLPVALDLYDLIPVINGNNPLNVHVGNPDLRPYYDNSFSLNLTKTGGKGGSVSLNMNGHIIDDQKSNSTTYDPETGVKTVTPRNIDGNWWASGHLALGKVMGGSRFQVNNHLTVRYNNDRNYLYSSSTKSDEVNTATRLMAKEKLQGTFRSFGFEATAFVGGEYTSERNLLRPSLNQEPYSLNGGVEVSQKFNFGLRLSSDFSFISNRGFAYESFNRSYNIWNAEISQRVFRGKGTVKLEWCDILGQQDNMIRTFSSERRSVSTYNGVNSYVMLRFIWQFKAGRA